MPADPGAIWFAALSGLGRQASDAMQQYHQEHQAYDQQMGIADVLSRMGIDEQGNLGQVDQTGTDKTFKPIIPSKTVDLYKTNVHAQQMKNLGAMEAINKMGMAAYGSAIKSAQANQAPAVFQGPGDTQFYRFPGGGSGVINKGSGKTGRDPSAQYINAVDAHLKSMNVIKSDLNDNFNADPSDILNSAATKGYVFKDGKYQFAKEGETPDAYQVYGQKGSSPMMSSDQFNLAKKRAKQYQDLSQKVPQQEDFTGQSRGGAATSGPPPGTKGVVNGVAAVWDGHGWRRDPSVSAPGTTPPSQ